MNVLEIEGLIVIFSDVHCKTRESFVNILKFLKEDYKSDKGDIDPDGPYDTYFFELKPEVLQKRYKCHHCNHYNTDNPILCNVEKCSNCGGVIYSKDNVPEKHSYLSSRSHYSEVRIYKGKEYPYYSTLPVELNYMVCPTYKIAPLPRNENLHKRILIESGQVPDCGYYYQDGREFFSRSGNAVQSMKLFIENFTDLNLQKFNDFVKTAPTDGPGFIRAFAKFVEEETQINQNIEDRPNVFHAIIGLSKALSGDTMTSDEKKAMERSLADSKTKEEFIKIIKER